MRQVRQQVYVRRGGADDTLGHVARTAAKTAAREAPAPDEAARAARNRSVDDADVPVFTRALVKGWPNGGSEV